MQQIADIFKSKKDAPKAPTYKWQDLALHIIAELKVPYSKRNSVFKVCKEYEKNFVKIINKIENTVDFPAQENCQVKICPYNRLCKNI